MSQLKGAAELLKKIQQFKDNSEVAVAQVCEGTANEVAADAKRNAPANFGKLRQGIIPQEVTKLNFKVVATEPYSAYVEFGTGAKVQVPAELADVAKEFQGQRSGTFEQGLQSIKDWCRAKGIPEEAAAGILISLIQNGQRPQPFLYPAFVKGRKQFTKDLEDVLNKLARKV